MVIAGHSHFYQHNLVNGIHHLVIGTAGAPFKDLVNASYTLKSAKEYNYAIIDMTPAMLHLVVYNNSGPCSTRLICQRPHAGRLGGARHADRAEGQRRTGQGEADLAAVGLGRVLQREAGDYGQRTLHRAKDRFERLTHSPIPPSPTAPLITMSSPPSTPRVKARTAPMISATPRVQIVALAVLGSGALKLLPKETPT